MAGSTKNTVHELFHSMESGPEGASSTNTAQAWLDHHSRSLGFFIDGKLVVPADRPSRSLTDCKDDEDVSVCSSSSVIGFKSWSELSCSQRAKVMLRMVGVLGQLLQFYSSWAQLRDALMPSWTPLDISMLDAAPNGSESERQLRHVQRKQQDGVLLCKATAGLGVSVSVSSLLGARCPFIVFESADIDSAVDSIVQNVFNERREVHWVLCVQESVQERLVSRLRLRMSGMKSLSLRSEEERRLVEAAVQEAEQQGATLVQSCSPPPSGAQYPPTVILGSAPSSPCVVAPPGTLLPLLTFRSNSEAVALDPSLPVSPHKESGSCTDGGQEVSSSHTLKLMVCTSSFVPPPLPPPSPRSSPLSMDYSQFGSAAPPTTIIPAESASWMKKSASARAQSLFSLAKGLEAKRRDLSASINTQTGLSLDKADEEVELSIARLNDWAAYCDKLQGGTPNPLLSMVTLLGAAISFGNAVILIPSEKNPLPALTFIQLTVALANHSVIKAIWYWGSAEGGQFLQHSCSSPLKTLLLSIQQKGGQRGRDWTHPSILEEMGRNAVQWKSVWIPTA
ncbi:Aldehyde dehydrogenase family 16 member A1 [Dissostichus eleginoides]|uniref:Aldehyde dehydrogenase family 16 member A1 n=1 Tax=Dissostichus eleginoides TaxID=100907 RepID=A0AAD9B7V0_DISEL|nr:Aldehyde dehydrogenase family 16 member A1 [Dissostichus eleginoides]